MLQAFEWYTKALRTVEDLISGVDADEFYKYVEAKGARPVVSDHLTLVNALLLFVGFRDPILC